VRRKFLCATFVITDIKLVEFTGQFRKMLEARLGTTENWMLMRYVTDVNFRRQSTVTHPDINKQIDKSDLET